MGNTLSINKINFEDIQTAIKSPELYLIINTLHNNEQECLIKNTVSIDKEEELINNFIKINKNIKIIIYGKHCNDELTEKKYYQLVKLGFYNVYVYSGGLFEWLMLQDIYGNELFPTNNSNNTNKKIVDFLKYKSPQKLNIQLLYP